MQYHDNMPFNDNQLRPCPMLENPEMIKKMVEASGAHSTDMQAEEPVDSLIAKQFHTQRTGNQLLTDYGKSVRMKLLRQEKSVFEKYGE